MTKEGNHKPPGKATPSFGHLRKAALAAAFLMAACGESPDPAFALRDATARLDAFDDEGREYSFGTAFAIGPHHWATAAHVIEGADILKIDGVQVRVAFVDEPNDTAVVHRPVSTDDWLPVRCAYEWPVMTTPVTTYGYSNAQHEPDRAVLHRGEVATDFHPAMDDGYRFVVTAGILVEGASGSAVVNDGGEVIGIFTAYARWSTMAFYQDMAPTDIAYAAPTFALCSWMRANG